jgi:hypothetical protein
MTDQPSLNATQASAGRPAPLVQALSDYMVRFVFPDWSRLRSRRASWAGHLPWGAGRRPIPCASGPDTPAERYADSCGARPRLRGADTSQNDEDRDRAPTDGWTNLTDGSRRAAGRCHSVRGVALVVRPQYARLARSEPSTGRLRECSATESHHGGAETEAVPDERAETVGARGRSCRPTRRGAAAPSAKEPQSGRRRDGRTRPCAFSSALDARRRARESSRVSWCSS